MTVSIGAVRAGDALRSVEGLVDCADRALAAAKRRGPRPRAAVRRSHGRGPRRRGAGADPAGPRARALARARARICRESMPSASPTWRSRSPSTWASTTRRPIRCRLGGLLHDIGTAAVRRSHPRAGRPAERRATAWRTRATRRRRAPRAQRRGRERRRRRRRGARGVVRRHRLSGRA